MIVCAWIIKIEGIIMKNNDKGFAIVEALIAMVALGAIVGVGYYVIDARSDSADSSATENLTNTAEDIAPDTISGVLPLEEVKTLATGGDESKEITGIELKIEDGVLVYEVHLSDGTVVIYNATSGVVIATKTDDDTTDDNSFPSDFTTQVTLAKAVEIAMAERPGVAISKIEIEVEDGVLVYSVRFADDGRVDIDANNGSIMEVRSEGGEKVKERSEKRNDDDIDDDGQKNVDDQDDDNDGKKDREDDDDDNDGVSGSDDQDDDNDDIDDDEDDDKDEEEEDEVEDENEN